jgi:hypothetical protein
MSAGSVGQTITVGTATPLIFALFEPKGIREFGVFHVNYSLSQPERLSKIDQTIRLSIQAPNEHLST